MAINKAEYFVTNRILTVKGTEAYAVYNLNGIKIANVKEASIELPQGVYIVRTKDAEVFKVIVR